MTFRELSFIIFLSLISFAGVRAQDTIVYEPGPLLKVKPALSSSSVSTVTGADLYKTPAANITNTLYGRLPGLTVLQGTGEPGYDDASMVIRGLGTYDNREMTIYVDGFQVTSHYFQYLSSSEIASVSVLKDAAALATFGMRGANGVLWIITKRGQHSKPTIQFQVRSGIQQGMNINKPLGSYDYARLYNQAISNDRYGVNGNQYIWAPKYSNAQLDAYKNGTGTNVDWYDEVLKKSTPYTDANLVFSGGDSTAMYGVIVDYMKDQGLYDVSNSESTSNAQIQRFNLRSNLDFNFFKIFEAKVDLGGRIEDRRYPSYNGPTLWSNMALYPSNIYPVKDESGNWSGTTIYANNPVASIRALGWISTHDRTLQANFNLKEKFDFITPGLYLNEAVSFNTWTRNVASKTATYARFYNGVQTTTDVTKDITASGNSPVGQYDWKQANLTAGYDRSFGVHAVSAAVNYFASSFVEDWNGSLNGLGVNTGNNIFHHYTNLSGRIHYVYNNRYVAEFGFAYSGSDNFAPGHNKGFYPAVSAAWIVSNEKFMQNSPVVNLLKIRVSVGKTGNETSDAGRYLYKQYYNNNGVFYTGNNSFTGNAGYALSYIANPDIFAAHSIKYNAGIDATLFNKLSVTADMFMDKRGGIITYDNNTYLATLGTSFMYKNIGKVTNKGFDLSVNFSDKVGKFRYNIGAMASYTKNKIDYWGEVKPVNDFNKTTGLGIGTPMGLVADGFYQLEDFNADGTLKAGSAVPAFGAVQPGDIKYKDMDKSGYVDQNDITKIGNPDFPSLYYSFNAGATYAGFDCQIFFQGAAGGDYNLLSASQSVAFMNNSNAYAIADGAWAYYPDQGIDTRSTATYPRLSTLANTNNYRYSTFWIKKNNFLRIRNIELGYSLPELLLNRLHLSRCRIFVSATNPVTWSSLLKDYNLDPETPSGYPGLKSYTSGLSLSF
ncbi:TonB-linked outer membrane protein, SusC/RagA family [Chitinophaga sp. CF118]|uniref:SusC/RagA family TonB-linked outer membrane protein n=1 Tax=Chitinophaga sp. CF118 TaxID=1884367 RepID=UPI0008EA08B6|nr:SusC/RagA family TonB-linked outer membrane protein [Chitinophaga sp. CF118]SFD55037.1 TonB-linked outer membrane protein, SusC/RagA family [Chitinophaga sp. CF118]